MAAQAQRLEALSAEDAGDEAGSTGYRVIEVAPAARPARLRARHLVLLISFIVMIVLPSFGAGIYLYRYAADQFASRVGFTVRREEMGSAFEILGGLTDFSSSSSSDTDILYEYIQSQELVMAVDAQLNLRELYSRPENDPVFSLEPDAPIEDLMDYWGRMVRVFYAPSTGLIEVETRAFDPLDAQAVAQTLFDLSAEMINNLSAVAAADTTQYAKDELDEAAGRLKEARLDVTRFRNANQIVDPSADINGQMGLLANLQGQLAAALIELDLLADSTRANDPRMEQAQRKITVIQTRIEEERRKLGVGGNTDSGTAFADLVGDYESLVVEREFAEKAYLSALSAYDTAVADARRRSRYLAAYVKPTLSQSPEYPQREVLLAVIIGALFGFWCLIVLIAYSLRDRR